jgi:very-short-patch-repair endonuclease
MKQEKLPASLARELRQNHSDAERLLWYQIRDRQLYGFKFRRQQPFDRYIADFVCLEQKLIVELDGGQHNEAINKKADEQRTRYFEIKGYRVLRFWNNDVIQNKEGVLEKIKEVLTQVNHPHLTSPVKGEERASIASPPDGED